jgi:glycosyltransferase involved in cell wall biosynthesis
MGNNLITILLPVYNDEKYLGYCLESIKNQSYSEFTCLVGFNGTIDKSKGIFDSIVGDDPRFVKIDYGMKSGKSITLNKMLSEVKTEITCLVDGDDIWHPEKLKIQMENMKGNDVVGSLTIYIDDRNLFRDMIRLYELNEHIAQLILAGHNQVINSSCFVRTECFRQARGWDHLVEGLEDFDMWVKLAKLGKRFYNVQEYLVYHRVHRSSNFNSKPLEYTPQDILKRHKIIKNI